MNMGNIFFENNIIAKYKYATRLIEPSLISGSSKLLLNFVPVEGYATVTGIEVLPQ